MPDHWTSALAALSERERESFERAVNLLLARSFLLKANEDTRRDYYFVDQQEALFEGFFRSIGWELMVDRVSGVCHVHSPEAAHRINLTAIETVLLLILRLLYEQKRKELSLARDVVIQIDDLQAQYMALRLRNRPLEKAALREAVARFARHQLLAPLDEDVTDPECRLVLYPSLAMALGQASLAEVHAKLKAFQQSEPGGDEA